MPLLNPGRLFLTLMLLFLGFGGTLVDANATHLFNPAWPPHARYHLVLQFVAFAALGGIGLWGLWQPGPDLRRQLNLATCICVVLSVSFYLPALVPTTSPLYAPDMDIVQLLGVSIPPNIFVGTLLLLGVPLAYRSASRALR